MKRTISIVTVLLTTIVAPGCCGGLYNLLHHPLGPNSICEPVHRAHYDNGFEAGYGSECADCGLGAAGPVCSCRKYGPAATACCLNCAMADDAGEVSKFQTVKVSHSENVQVSRSGKMDRAVKQASYTTGCTDCVESEPCCGGCGQESCECCAPRCPETYVECVGPLSWFFAMLHPEKYYGGCGEIYWGDFHSYPPDCTDPCNRCGKWTGQCNCNAWTGCNVCGQCGASYGEPCQSCQSCGSGGEGGGEGGEVFEESSAVEGPVLISQTDRVVRPAVNVSRTANAKREYTTKQR